MLSEARCVTEHKPVSFFFPRARKGADGEFWRGEIRRFCAGCKVRVECLELADFYARTDGVVGFWGGQEWSVRGAQLPVSDGVRWSA